MFQVTFIHVLIPNDIISVIWRYKRHIRWCDFPQWNILVRPVCTILSKILHLYWILNLFFSIRKMSFFLLHHTQQPIFSVTIIVASMDANIRTNICISVFIGMSNKHTSSFDYFNTISIGEINIPVNRNVYFYFLKEVLTLHRAMDWFTKCLDYKPTCKAYIAETFMSFRRSYLNIMSRAFTRGFARVHLLKDLFSLLLTMCMLKITIGRVVSTQMKSVTNKLISAFIKFC